MLKKKVTENFKSCRKVPEQLVAKPNRDPRAFLFLPLTSLRHKEASADFKRNTEIYLDF